MCQENKGDVMKASSCETVGVLSSQNMVSVMLEVCLFVWQGLCDCV